MRIFSLASPCARCNIRHRHKGAWGFLLMDGNTTRDPLDVVVRFINEAFESAAKYETKAGDKRISAGLRLVELKQRIKAGEAGAGVKWTDYVAQHVKRSIRDCQKVMRIAAAPDPEAALAEERAKARDGMAAGRSRDPETDAANVSRI